MQQQLFIFPLFEVNCILRKINRNFFKFSGELSTKLMLQKDGRVKVMAEILRGIRVIKFHVWEDHFVDKIGSEFDMTQCLSALQYLIPPGTLEKLLSLVFIFQILSNECLLLNKQKHTY